MSNTSNVRATVLAALMVLSVIGGSIAFTGSVAADSHEFTYEGGAVHYENSSAAVIEVPFNDDVNDSSLTAANFTLTDDGTNVSDRITGYSVDNGTLLIETDDLVRSNDLELELSEEIENASGASLSNAGTKTVDFASVTVGANDDVDAYKGSKVAVVAQNASTDVEIAGTDDDNDFYRSGNTGANSSVYVFDTSNRAVGEYEVTYENGSTATVTVRELGLAVDVDETNVTTDDPVEGTVSANAGNRQVNVKLLDSDGDEVENETVDLSGQAQSDFSFDVSDADDYTVEATDLGSGVTAESDTVTVTDAGEGRADFAEGVITEQRGDVANITVDVQNADTATLTVGTEDVGYRTNVTVEDGSDDGQVSVLFDTYEASVGNPQDAFEVADSDDSVESVDPDGANAVDSLLEAGEYDLEVRTGDDASVDAENVATLVLEERNTSSIESWTAPTGTSFADTDELYEAVGNGNLTRADDIAQGDVAVHRINASGLQGVLDAEQGEEVTSAFWNAEGNQFDLTVEQANPGANRDPYTVDLSGQTVLADPANDTYYVVYETESVSASERSIDTGDTLNANFTVLADEGNLTVEDEDQTVEDEYELVEGEHTLDEPVNVSASGSQTISGETTVAPGTELSLRVRSSGDTQPSFLKTANVYVTENRTFSGTFDFSEQEVGDTFEVTVRNGAADSVTVDGNVVEGGANGTENGTGTETVTETEMATDAGGESTATDGEATATPTEGGEATASPTEAGGEGTTGGEGGSGTQTPGFGVVVALTALLAAALIAVRRD